MPAIRVTQAQVAWAQVAWTQLRFILLRERRAWLVFAALALLWLLGPWSQGFHGRPGHVGSSLLPPFPVLLVLAVWWALAIWQDESPRNRRYFWSLPVGRRQHEMLRTALGAGVLLAGVLAWTVLTLLVESLGSRPGSLAGVSAEVWINLFLAPLTIYLLMAPIGLASDSPGRWIAGIAAVCGLLVALLGRTSINTETDPILGWLFDGPLGLGTALFRPLHFAFSINIGPDATAPEWWPAALTWFLIGVALTLAAIHRPHPR